MFTYKLIEHLVSGGGKNVKKHRHHIQHAHAHNHTQKTKGSDLSPEVIPSSDDSSTDSRVLHSRLRSSSTPDRAGATGSPSPPHRARASSFDRVHRHHQQKGALPLALRPTANFLLFGSYVMTVGILLTLCDYFCHVRFGVLKYAEVFPESSYFPDHPTLEVLKGFLGIGVFFVMSGNMFFGGSRSSPGRAVLSLAVFVAEYYCSGLFKDSPMMLHNSFLTVWVLQLLSYSTLKTIVPFCVLLGIIGPVVEGFYSTTGFFVYAVPDLVYHTPIWLCSLYMNGGIVAASSLCWINNFKYNV